MTKPRRWNDTLGGIRWLPRLIDKARMAQRGELGTYLLGHSPVDASLLQQFGLTTNEFAAIVAACPDDEAVLAQLRARGYDEARLAQWSERMPRDFALSRWLTDRDEGYVMVGPAGRAFMAIFQATQRGWVPCLRWILRAP
jgi:hypothetical protein